MATVFFSLTTGEIVTANDVKVVLYKLTDPLAEYDSQTQTGPLGVTQWTFTGLPRVPFKCRILEVSGATILQEYGWFTFVPDNNEVTFRAPEWIEVDSTTGLTSATTTFTFDGTGGKPDWTDGHDITVERKGLGTMQEGTEYTYDPTTQEFNLIQSGDEFQPGEKFFIRFEPLVQAGGDSTQEDIFAGTKFVTADETLTASDAGKKIIIKGADPYIEVTLPTLALTTENRIFYFESAPGYHECVRIISQDANKLEYPKTGQTSICMKPGETLSIFKSIDGATQTWRVHEAEGNYKTVGQEFTTYGDPDDLVNAIELVGGEYDADEQARLYDWILNLPATARCNYADHATGDNVYLFSLKDAGSNMFFVPDLTDLFQRNTSGSRLAGSYQHNMMLEHKHRIGLRDGTPGGTGGYGRDTGESSIGYGLYSTSAGTERALTDKPSVQVDANNTSYTDIDGNDVSGPETRPNNYGSRRYIYA